MYISFNCLKELVKLPKNLSAEELANLFNLHTVEVERVIYQQDQYAQILVAEILSIKNHPRADHLKIVELDTGKERVKVVCGANNIALKQKVALALPGAVLANGLEIKETEIRGEKSFGMICAEDELALGHDHEGILVLDKKAKKGDSLANHLALNDIILEIDNKSLSHRGDLWGHYGLAREAGAILKTELKPYSDFIEKIDKKVADPVKVKIENKELCPRYLAWRVNNIKIEESPAWLKNKVIAAGFRPINNIVDATNYVMIESGQPLHAFCANELKNIVVRLAKKNESIETIDGKERDLTENDLVIASEEKILAIAGVMGAANSGVNLETKSIILESAVFDAISVRKTAQSLNLRTEASSRYEKSLDPEFAPLVLNRLASIIKKLCPEAEFMAEPSDLINYPEGSRQKIVFSSDWITKRLGKEIKKKEIISILEHLGFETEVKGEEISLLVPSWRAVKDVQTKEDILEEIARIFGYNNIDSSLPITELRPLIINPDLKLERKIKDFLSKSAALSEVYNYAFVAEKQLLKIGIDTSSHLRLANPVSETHDLLRQSLVPNLLQNIVSNQFNFKHVSFFELGRVFLPIESQLDKDGGKEKLPWQEKKLALALAADKDSFSSVKGVLQALMENLFGRNIEIEFVVLENPPAWADSSYSAGLKVAGEDLGLVAKIKEETANKIGIKLDGAIAEIDFFKLLEIFINFPNRKHQALFKYPALERDLAFVVEDKIMYNELYKAILSFNSLISSLELFDVYSGSKLGDNLKSLAFHVSYRSSEKTLLAEEVDELQKDLLKFLEEKFNARLRDF